MNCVHLIVFFTILVINFILSESVLYKKTTHDFYQFSFTCLFLSLSATVKFVNISKISEPSRGLFARVCAQKSWRRLACSFIFLVSSLVIAKKLAHTLLPSVGFRSWSRFLAVSLQSAWVINPAVGCRYFPPGLHLPPQPLRGLQTILLLSVLDSVAEGPGFKSQSRRCRVTVLGKLFTPIVPLFTKQQKW